MSAFPEKMRYEGVPFNVISIMMGGVGVKFLGKKRYVIFEWPLYDTLTFGKKTCFMQANTTWINKSICLKQVCAYKNATNIYKLFALVSKFELN